jgi:alkylhydroperoxidase family enzyme
MEAHPPEHRRSDADASGSKRPGEGILASLLHDSAVPASTLNERYGPLLELIQTVIGVVPNCDGYLEIWPPAFRTYNIMVPNFLNLPFSIFGVGGAPADIVGLGLYVASRVAECPYCSAHTCSFALRRGASPEKLAQALAGGSTFTAGELATLAVARSLGRIPTELTAAEREELERRFAPDQVEWIVVGISMMGFLNKFMDAVGVELEPSVVSDVRPVMGASWSTGKAGRDLDPDAPARRPPKADSLWTKLRIIPLFPYAIRIDKRWQEGVPRTWPAVGTFLEESVGYAFPVLSRLRHSRVIQSIASMLRENLDASTSVLGLPTKVLCGVVFASVICDEALAGDVRSLGRRWGLADERMDAVARFATTEGQEAPACDVGHRAALILARAASPSPAAIDASTVEACRQGGLQPAAVVELVSWISVLQMLHRLSSYYRTLS